MIPSDIMKNIILSLLLFSSVICKGQSFSEYVLIDDITGESSIRDLYATDIDLDGDIDILTVTTGLLSWYENLDGEATFSSRIIIDPINGSSRHFEIVDLNEDDLPEIIVSNANSDTYTLYWNLGNGDFENAIDIAAGVDSAFSTAAADIDGDNDLDIVLGVVNGSGLHWIENVDGQGSYGPIQTIDPSISSARLQLVTDVDGDGDLDIISNTSNTPLRVVWYENTDGQGTFNTQHTITDTGLYNNFMDIGDIDGDGDVDFLGNSPERLSWRPSIEGQGNYGEENIISESPPFARARLIDFDLDGDLDILFNNNNASNPSATIAWFENIDGQGNFSAIQTVSTGLPYPNEYFTADLDGDGDLDIVFQSSRANQPQMLAWIENTSTLGFTEQAIAQLKVYPNPTQNILFIESSVEITAATLLDLSGKMLYSSKTTLDQINMSGMTSGIYFLELSAGSSTVTKKIIVK